MKKFLRVIAVAMLLLAIAIPCLAESDECTAYKDGKHVWTGAGRSPETCENTGKINYKCACGDTKETTVSKLGHDYSKVVVDKPASCGKSGEGHYECSVCDKKGDNVTIPATGKHTETSSSYVRNATCGVDGYKVIKYCSVCYANIEIEVIPATGEHDYSRVTIKESTCTEKGYTALKCSVCNYVNESTKEDKKLADHAWSTEATHLVSEATCTEPEMRCKYCTKCGAYDEAVAVAKANGHTWSKWVKDKDATCTEKGAEHKTCTVCGEVYSVETAMKDHTPVWEIVDATCTKDGSTTKVCSGCGEVYETKTIPATGHDIVNVDWTVSKKAVACTAGEMVKICKTCEQIAKTEVIEPTGDGKHKAADEWTIVRQPNAYQEGKAIKSCVYCGTQMAKKYFTNAASLGNAKVDTSKKDTTTSSSSSSSKNNTTSSSSSSKNNTAATTSTPTVKAVVAVEPVVVKEWKLGEKFEIADGVFMTITLNAETNKYDVVVEGVDNIETAKIAFVAADATEAPADEAYTDLIKSNWVIDTVDEAAILYIVID